MSDQEQGRFAKQIQDWVTALDDGFRYTHTHCTLCGKADDGYFDVATLENGFGVAYRLCQQCHALDKDRAKTAAVLQRRYGEQP